MAVCLRALDRCACRMSSHMRQIYQLRHIASTKSFLSTAISKCQWLQDKNWISPLASSCSFKNVAGIKRISTSSVLMKKFQEEKYEKLQIYDPDGNFLCVHELIVLEKFCHHYHKYTFVEMDTQERENTNNNVSAVDGGDGSYRSFQLVKKPTKQKNEHHDKKGKVKEIKFKAKAEEVGWKLAKLKQILLDKEIVHIVIHGKGDSTQLEKDIKEGIAGISTIKEQSHADNRVSIIATLSDLGTDAYRDLLDELYEQEATKLDLVQELIKEKHKYDSDN